MLADPTRPFVNPSNEYVAANLRETFLDPEPRLKFSGSTAVRSRITGISVIGVGDRIVVFSKKSAEAFLADNQSAAVAERPQYALLS